MQSHAMESHTGDITVSCFCINRGLQAMEMSLIFFSLVIFSILHIHAQNMFIKWNLTLLLIFHPFFFCNTTNKH